MFRSTHDFETKIFREICTLLARLLPRVRRIAVRAKNACCVRSVRRGENFVSGAFVESVSVQIIIVIVTYCMVAWFLKMDSAPHMPPKTRQESHPAMLRRVVNRKGKLDESITSSPFAFGRLALRRSFARGHVAQPQLLMPPRLTWLWPLDLGRRVALPRPSERPPRPESGSPRPPQLPASSRIGSCS